MKKEKTVKTYQRRTKTGKVVTVRQHTAKYDAADKAAEVSKKKGSGDELEALKKSRQDDTPMEISKDDFKEWYNFNEWDTPKKEWPDAVKKVDSHLRKTMGKKGYDDYCAKIDESWSARGHLKAYKDFSASSSSSPTTAKVAKPKADSKQVKDTNYTSNGSYYNSKLSPEEFMGKFFKLHSSGKYTEAAKMLDDTLGKGAWDALNKKAPSFAFDSTKDRNEKFMGLVEEQVGEHHWNSQQGKPKPIFGKMKVGSHVGAEPKKTNHIDEDFMDLYNNMIKKGAYRRMSDYKDQNDFRFKEALKTLRGKGYKVTLYNSDGQDGSLLNVTDPQGKKVISDTFAKDSAAGNGHLLTLERLAFTKNRRKEKAKERNAPIFDTKGTSTKTKSSSSSSSSTKFKSSINEVLNNAGFKNDISSIKVDGDSVKIRLEGKAYGDGYSSYVRYNPTRPKDGYEAEGNPKRAGRVYEALRKLKGINKIKSLVITESYD